MFWKRVAVLLVLGAAFLAQADDGDDGINADRPGQANPPYVVPPGTIQIETGFLYNDGRGGSDSLDAFQTLFRVGIVKRVELRVSADGFSKDFSAGDEGLGDLGIGAKIKIHEPSGWIPDTGVIVGTTLPAGERAFSSQRYDPSFTFVFESKINDRVNLDYNVGLQWQTTETTAAVGLKQLIGGKQSTHRETDTLFNYSLCPNISLTKKVGTFVEIFGIVPVDGSGGPAHYADGGFTWTPNDNLQFDVFAGVGLSHAADDWFFGGGMSVRFPKR